jgi:hypothetical protein
VRSQVLENEDQDSATAPKHQDSSGPRPPAEGNPMTVVVKSILGIAVIAVATAGLGACALLGPPPSRHNPPPPPSGGGTVGYLGCSNTWMAVAGYHDVDGTGRLWPSLPAYGGGSVDQWTSASSHYWASFDAQEAATPATAIWWHLCLHPGTTVAQAQAVIAILRSKVGNVPIYATAMATYADPTECPIADPADSLAIQQSLIAQGVVQAGPMLTPLSRANTTDGCHPDLATRDADGRSLAAFFG